MKVNIRPATARDRADWIAMRTKLWPDCPAERHNLEVAQILRAPGVVALAFVDEKLAGFAELSVRSDHVEGTENSPVPYLEGWYVSSPYRSRGVGRSLIAFVEDWARSKGFQELASDAERENRRSIRLHELLGFREVSTTVHFVKALK